jgi:hypothetical protein
MTSFSVARLKRLKHTQEKKDNVRVCMIGMGDNRCPRINGIINLQEELGFKVLTPVVTELYLLVYDAV